MRVKALVSFSGIVSMAKGEERDITNDVLLKDLLQAGYVEKAKPAKAKKEKGDTYENQ